MTPQSIPDGRAGFWTMSLSERHSDSQTSHGGVDMRVRSLGDTKVCRQVPCMTFRGTTPKVSILPAEMEGNAVGFKRNADQALILREDTSTL